MGWDQQGGGGIKTDSTVGQGSSKIVVCKLEAGTDSIEITSYLPPTMSFPSNLTAICYHNPTSSWKLGKGLTDMLSARGSVG